MSRLRHLSFAPCRASRITLAVAAAIGMSMTLIGSDARATCGDYLMMDGSLHRSTASADAGDSSATMPPTRCHGPNCTKGERNTPAPTPTYTPPQSNDWAAMLIAESSPPSLGRDWVCLHSDIHSQRVLSRIFRPPRTAA